MKIKHMEVKQSFPLHVINASPFKVFFPITFVTYSRESLAGGAIALHHHKTHDP
jgi:hypothetical protein